MKLHFEIDRPLGDIAEHTFAERWPPLSDAQNSAQPDSPTPESPPPMTTTSASAITGVLRDGSVTTAAAQLELTKKLLPRSMEIINGR
jgi:hypothetical protein